MTLFLADEAFKIQIVTGVRARVEGVDIVTVRGAGLAGRKDALVLEWAAAHDRVVLTHDFATMPNEAGRRIAADLSMPGMVLIEWTRAIGPAIEDLELLIQGYRDDEWENNIVYLRF